MVDSPFSVFGKINAKSDPGCTGLNFVNRMIMLIQIEIKERCKPLSEMDWAFPKKRRN